jgi:signal transduction histidine kinase
MQRLSRIKVLLGVIIVCFGAAAVYISFAVIERQQFLREVSRYNLAWVASQAVNEELRFRVQLMQTALSGKLDDVDEVRTRLDILFNRLNIFTQGTMGPFTARHPDEQSAIAELAVALREIEPMLDHLGDPGTVDRILGRLTPLQSRLSRFAAAANNFGGEQVADDQYALFRLHWIFSGLAGGLVLCGLALIGLLFMQNREIRESHDALRAMTADLRRAKDVAEAASDAKSRFLANMSHELRTPLNAIIGFSELIAEETFGPIGQARYRDYAADILKSGRHMFELVNDILTMARIDAGRVDLSLEPVDLGAALRATISMLNGTEMGQGRAFAVDGLDDEVRLRADERALRQMLLNLLSNAVKFSDPATTVRILFQRQDDGGCQLTVADEGIGMTVEEAKLAVMPFQQIDSGLTRRYEGTGLGLAIVKGLIERHGGSLTIDSEPGEGCRVSLVFPATLVLPGTLTRAA